MPTTVTSKIGATNSPVTMDYSTLQSWEDACPANLVTADQIWRGECYDQDKFTSAVSIGGITTDSTRRVVLTCASGASFKDKAAVRSTALTYNSTTGSGVAVEISGSPYYCIKINIANVDIDGLQVKRTGSFSDAVIQRDVAGSGVLSNLIISSPTMAGLSDIGSTSGKFVRNCLFISGFSGTTLPGNAQCYGCTIINTGGSGTAIESKYNEAVLKNCAVFGFSAVKTNTLASGTDYNASDLSSFGTGTHNQTSLTFASQFVSTTTDFRAVDTGSLDLNGTPDATNTPTDISGTTRHATTPTIGCWEVVASVISSSIYFMNIFDSLIKSTTRHVNNSIIRAIR